MSGRVRHWRDGELITNRKTDRRQSKSVPAHLMPDYRLTFMLPAAQGFAVAPGKTPIAGVTVLDGGMVEARGKNRDWVLKQAGEFIGSVANGQDMIISVTLTRDDNPPLTSGAPAKGGYRMTREMVYVPSASVVFLHQLKKALVFPVNTR